MTKNQELGIEIIAAIKANCYGISLKVSLAMTRDILDLTGEYKGASKYNIEVKHKREKLLKKADFVVAHTFRTINKLKI